MPLRLHLVLIAPLLSCSPLFPLPLCVFKDLQVLYFSLFFCIMLSSELSVGCMRDAATVEHRKIVHAAQRAQAHLCDAWDPRVCGVPQTQARKGCGVTHAMLLCTSSVCRTICGAFTNELQRAKCVALVKSARFKKDCKCTP